MIKKLFSKNDAKTLKFKNEFKELFKLEKQSKKRFLLDEKNLYPCLFDNTSETGFDRHYVYHPAWASRIVLKNNPTKHVDISSTLHFCSTLSAFLPVEFYDYRPANLELPNLKSLAGNLLELPFESNSVE